MRIHSISMVLAIPFAIWLGYFLIQIFDSAYSDTSMVIVPVVALTILYISHGYIDNWWWKKFPPRLETKVKEWVIKYLAYYNNLPEESKVEFEKRLVLYVENREFKTITSQEPLDVPHDLKNIIASQGIRLCLGLKDYLIKDMDRVYLYKHPFPTPRFQYLHNVEVDVVDGVYIFSTEYGIPGIINSKEYYNIVLHGYAEAFVLLHQTMNFPDVNQYGWDKLNEVKGFDTRKVFEHTRLQHIDLLPVHIVCFFDYHDEYEKVFPQESYEFDKIFNYIEVHK